MQKKMRLCKHMYKYKRIHMYMRMCQQMYIYIPI